MSFPIDASDQREFAADWSGDVFVCDIDRTYLATRLSSLKGMAKIPFEFAVDKAAIDGMTTLLKEIRRGPASISRQTPLYFVSASPAQLRPVIERKMLLDGLEFDGTTFKNWLAVVKSRRFKRFKEQIGFKLTALLEGRRRRPRGARETLIGDDHESDAIIFTLYADVLAGRISGEELLSLLKLHNVADDDAQGVVELAGEVDRAEGVSRAYVRLEQHRDEPDPFLAYAPHLVGCRSALQIAASLWADGKVGEGAVIRVARELLRKRYSKADLTDHLADAARRGLLGDQGPALQASLEGAQVVEQRRLPAVEARWAQQSQRSEPFWTPTEHR